MLLAKSFFTCWKTKKDAPGTFYKIATENKPFFNRDFSDGDVLRGTNFSKENDYFIMSISCFIEVSNDITNLKQHDDIEKKSIIANHYIRNKIDYGFDSPEIEIIFDDKT